MANRLPTITESIDLELGKIHSKQFIIKPWNHKKKKDVCKFFVYDGLIPFTVSLVDLCCNCGNKLCKHLMYVLYYHLLLNSLTIYMLQENEIRDKLISLIGDTLINKLNNQMSGFICEFLERNDQTCSFCILPLTHRKYKFELVQCNGCHTFFHFEPRNHK